MLEGRHIVPDQSNRYVCGGWFEQGGVTKRVTALFFHPRIEAGKSIVMDLFTFLDFDIIVEKNSVSRSCWSTGS